MDDDAAPAADDAQRAAVPAAPEPDAVPPISTPPLGTPLVAPHRPVRRPLHPRDLDALDFILDVFLPEAAARGLRVPAVPEVRPLLDDLAAEARGAVPPVPPGAAPAWGAPVQARPPVRPPARQPWPVTDWPPQPPASLPPRPAASLPPRPAVGQPGMPSGGATFHVPGRAPAPAPAAPRPTPVRDAWERLRQAVGSDLGVHGLAYLGVLLLFVGVFGLVAFAFGEVTPSLRPVAEAAAAVVPFLGARLLLGHGAAVVGRALEVVGGLLLPLMLITSQVDGYAIPPNPTGTGLVVGLTAVCVACAVAFAAWSRRRPDSGLRYAAAPSLWLAAAMATIGVGRELPSGQDVAVPSSAQTAALAVALALTLLAARARPAHPLARATRSAAVPGLVVATLLAVLSWSADGVPVVPVVVAGVALLTALELLRSRVPAAVVDGAGPVWVGAVGLALGLGSAASPAVVAAGVVVTFVALVELAARRAAPSWAVDLPATGLAVGLLTMWPASWLTVAVLTVVLVWALVRRTRPIVGTGPAFDAFVAVLPFALAAAVAGVTRAFVGLAVGGALTAAATVPATTSVLRRDPTDLFWTHWWRGAMAVASVAAVLSWALLPAPGPWVAVAVLTVLGAVALRGPVAPVLRPWVVVALLGGAWLLAATTAGLPGIVRGGVLAVAGLAMVLVSGRQRPSPALAGHALGLVALGTAGPDWGLVLVAALATAGWAVTAVRGERGGSRLVSMIDAAGLGYAPWGLVALGLPTVAGLALDRGDVLTPADPWRVLVPVATALAYAAVARWTSVRRPGVVAAGVSFTAALVAVASSASSASPASPWPAVVALAAVPAAVALLPRALRPPPLAWTAWFAVAPLVGLAARELWPAFGALPGSTATAVTLTAVGGALVVVGTAVAGDRFRREPGPARGVGVVQLGAALALAVLVVPATAGAWLVVAIAAVLLVVAIQARLGALGGAALALAWGGVVSLTWARLHSAPWLAVAVAAGLLVAAEGLHRLLRERGTWTRWDIPVLTAAAPVAATALAAAADGAAFPTTSAAVGGLVVAVAVRLRTHAAVREGLGALGSVLELAGAADASPGWLSLALLALGATHTGLAVRAVGPARVARQVLGASAAVASWAASLAWLEVSSQVAVDASAVLAAAVLLVLALAARLRPTDRSWHAVWGTAALAVLGTAVLGALGGPTTAPTVAVALAVAAVAPAGYLAAGPLRLPGLRDLAAVAVLGAVLLGLAAADAAAATAVLVLCLVALLGAAGGVAAAMVDRSQARPLVEVGVGGVVAALCVALVGSPDASLLVPVVAVSAVQAASGGVVLRSVGLQVTAPLLACLAWLLAVASPARAPEWYTIAVGLSLLVVVAIWRRDRRGRGLDPAASEVVVLEVAGIAFVVVASLVRAVSAGPAHAAVAVGLGLLVAVWGVVTRVRRRLAAGVVVVVVAVVLLVAVPLVRLLPSWGGAGGWLMMAGAGLVAVLAATMMERSRTAVRSAVGKVGELTAGWE